MGLARIAKRAAALLPLTVVAAGLALPAAAGASQPGPTQIPLKDPGPIGCPAGTFVEINPGPVNSPSFVLINPGPTNCPSGIDVLKNPGPIGTPQGSAAALPLSAASCQAGTALFDTELSLLGASAPGPTPVGVGPVVGASPCPDGYAAFAALQAALANVPVAPPGAFGLVNPGPPQVPGGFVLINAGPVQAPAVFLAYAEDPTGTPNGLYVEKDPGPAGPKFLVLAPTGTPGVAVLKNPGPQG